MAREKRETAGVPEESDGHPATFPRMIARSLSLFLPLSLSLPHPLPLVLFLPHIRCPFPCPFATGTRAHEQIVTLAAGWGHHNDHASRHMRGAWRWENETWGHKLKPSVEEVPRKTMRRDSCPRQSHG